MKIKQTLSKITLTVLSILLCFAVCAEAQRKKPVKKTTPTKSTTPTVSSSLEVKAGAEKVSIQIKHITKFIYTLGGVAAGIEDADKEAKAGKLSKAGLDKNNQFKQQVIQSIKNLRAGLAALEVEFRTKPALKPYLLQIQGITDLSGLSEDQAMSGKFTDSGKTLLLVVEKLADTLAAMP